MATVPLCAVHYSTESTSINQQLINFIRQAAPLLKTRMTFKLFEAKKTAFKMLPAIQYRGQLFYGLQDLQGIVKSELNALKAQRRAIKASQDPEEFLRDYQMSEAFKGMRTVRTGNQVRFECDDKEEDMGDVISTEDMKRKIDSEMARRSSNLQLQTAPTQGTRTSIRPADQRNMLTVQPTHIQGINKEENDLLSKNADVIPMDDDMLKAFMLKMDDDS
jgi:hypothetical protein